MEKGFLFTSRQMLLSPGKSVKEFIEGKRKNYQPPVSYFLIWIGLYLLLLYFTEKIFGENKVVDFKQYFGPDATTKFAISHLSLVLAMVMPFQAFYLYILTGRKLFNYFESLVAVIYALGTIVLFQAVFVVAAILVYLITNVSVNLNISDALKVFYLAWFTVSLFKVLPLDKKGIRIIAMIILSFGTFTVWRLYGFKIVASHFFYG